MTPLGSLDALFLHLETAATPMHVGALNLLDSTMDGSALFARIRAHIETRLATSAVLTRRLRQIPLGIANPFWVDGGAVDLDAHLKRLRLPAPGTQAQLESAVGTLHAQRLDRRRPLWQFWLIEGLADGGCALYSKIHHAAVDGAAGVSLAQALLDSSPVAQASAPPPQDVRGQHADAGLVRLLGRALAQNGRTGARLLGQLPALARGTVASLRGSRAGALIDWARGVELAPATFLNRSIDGRRSVATVSVPLGEVRAVADAAGVSVNDVVLSAVGGALRQVLSARGQLPEASLLAAMPLSLRDPGDTRMNTQAWMMQATLATNVAEPLQRLRAVHASTAVAKSMKTRMRPAFDLTLPSLGQPWLVGGAAALYGSGGLAERLPLLANVVVSNVPGPAAPLYLAGVRLRTYWPLSIVEHGLGLNVTVVRYVDSLDFGLVAARRLLPDPAPLAHALRAALGELRAATARPSPERARKRRASKKQATVVDGPADAPENAGVRAVARPASLTREARGKARRAG